MGPLIFLTAVVAIVVVIGFVIYGMLLGLGALGQDLKRLLWPELPVEERLVVMAPLQVPVVAATRASQRHCWEAHGCQPGQRECCPAYKHPDLPCWLANMRKSDGYKLKAQCLNCEQFSLPALVN